MIALEPIGMVMTSLVRQYTEKLWRSSVVEKFLLISKILFLCTCLLRRACYTGFVPPSPSNTSCCSEKSVFVWATDKLTNSYFCVCVITLLRVLPYSGKLSWEKTFANWWKKDFHGEHFRRLLAGATKRCHAPKFHKENVRK